jgi:lysophospholipase L1-like esterase
MSLRSGRGSMPVAAMAVAAALFMVFLATGRTGTAARAAVPGPPGAAGPAGHAWVGGWATAPVLGSGAGFADRTLRQIVRVGLGGDAIRVRLTNAFGADGVRVDGVRVGLRQAGAAVVAGTERAVTFGGLPQVTLAAGAQVLSDPVALAVQGGQDLAISMYVPGDVAAPTRHGGAFTTSYFATGDHSGEAAADAFTGTTTSWFLLDGVDVRTTARAGAVVALGDSITEGTCSTVDANRRFPDALARRVAAGRPGRPLSVLNAGTSGNRLVSDAGTNGVSAQARFERDVLAQSGARDVILLEGINDIGHNVGPVAADPVTPQDLIAAMSNIVRAAHAAGLRVIGGTLLPIAGSKYDTPEAEAKRQAVNDWIRRGRAFDAVVDFDAALRDPADPARYLPAYDCGDHLHPGDAGYQAMADAVDLKAL